MSPRKGNSSRPPRERALGEQGERTRRRLLEAAKEVIRDRGYTGARVDDVVTRAGTSHGAFYLYFANKQELIEALALETSERMEALARTLEEIHLGEPAYGELRAWVEDFVDLYRENAPVLTAWVQAEPEDPALDRIGREVLGRITGEIAHAVERAVASGARHPVDPRIAATALVAMLDRLCDFWLVRGAPFERQKVVETVTAIWYRAIFGVPG